MRQLSLFSASPARCQRFLVYYREVSQVVYPGTDAALLHVHRDALYIAPEGLYRLHWWQIKTRGGGVALSLKTWYSPLPKPASEVLDV